MTFNAAGLCVVNEVDRRRYLSYIQDLAQTRHILCIQEVHGFEGEVLSALKGILPNWTVFHSPCVSAGGTVNFAAGGVATCFCPSLANSFDSLDATNLSSGRCLAACGSMGPKVLTVVNVHNSDMGAGEVTVVTMFLRSLRLEVQSDP